MVVIALPKFILLNYIVFNSFSDQYPGYRPKGNQVIDQSVSHFATIGYNKLSAG